MVVVLLLNVNCISQYALCGLNLGFNRHNRPAAGVGICIVFAVSTGAIAGLYSNFSPLGKEYESEFDEEVQNQTFTTDPTGQQSRLNASPQWRGGIFNLWDDGVRQILGLVGIVLCVFGLLYGGFRRIQMRKRFNLPGNNLCCWKPALTDCAQRLCCACCSLAQEVRTADYYDIAENKFYTKQDDNSQPAMPSFPHEDRAIRFSPSIKKIFIRLKDPRTISFVMQTQYNHVCTWMRSVLYAPSCFPLLNFKL
ncbi:unnamed protein product, partial [Vitis vinifera]